MKPQHHRRPVREKSAVSLEEFAGEDKQYKRKLEKIKQEKTRKTLLHYKKTRALNRAGYSDDNDLPKFVTTDDLERQKRDHTQKQSKKSNSNNKQTESSEYSKSGFSSAMKHYEEKQRDIAKQQQQKKREQKEKKKQTFKRIEKKKKLGMKTKKGQPVMKFKILDMLNTIKKNA